MNFSECLFSIVVTFILTGGPVLPILLCVQCVNFDSACEQAERGCLMWQCPDNAGLFYPGTNRISPANLIYYFPFDQVSGPNTQDYGPFNFPGTLSPDVLFGGVPPPVPWPTQGALRFTAVGQPYVTLHSITTFCFGPGTDISIAFWAQQLNQPGQGYWIIDGPTGSPLNNFIIRSGDGGGHPQTIDFFWQSPHLNFNVLRWQDALNPIVLGSWFHLAFTWKFGDPIGNAHLYLRGIDQGVPMLASGAVANPPGCSGPGDFVMALQSPFQFPQQGSIFDLRLYDRILSPAEVALLAA
jgi:hypothetical protein